MTNPSEPATRRQQAFLAALFVIGLGLRWLFADGDFIGDDAWYRGSQTSAAGRHLSTT
ncbi:MAG: hypothetical protein RL701_2651 [Pseudomonadota bacterium]|jgi:hypothetical protein